MCGIAGFYRRRSWDASLAAMSRAVAHRGPDESGEFRDGPVELAIRRLSVIDIAGGSQPIKSEDGAVVVVYNGEIFNFRELRAELQTRGHRFSTRTDTEVLVHGYEEWGGDLVDHLNGQFAFAIWDGRRLFLARDRMGEKPLYYALTEDAFVFASEIKGVLEVLPSTPHVPESFWVWDVCAPGETLFEGVRELPPAHALTFDGERVVVRRYWDIPGGPIDERSEEALSEELRALLEDAIRIRLVSDVPVGIFLSGGMDSAAIACVAKPEIAFSCRFPLGPQFDEFPYSRLVAEHIGARQIVVEPTVEDFHTKLPSVVRALDQPVATASVIAEFMLAEKAREHGIKVILGGQGADEIFGGYVRYLLMHWERRIGDMEELRNYHSLARFFWNPAVFGDPVERYFDLVRRQPPADRAPYVERVRSYFDRHEQLIDKMGHFDAAMTLTSLLTMNDRACAAVGLENRCPFLDHRLVEFAFRIPERYKINGGGTKQILRRALRGIVPDAILDRKDKKGLVVPFAQWLNGPLQAWTSELESGLTTRLRVPGDGGLRGEFDRGRYMRVCLELWFREFFPDFRSDHA